MTMLSDGMLLGGGDPVPVLISSSFSSKGGAAGNLTVSTPSGVETGDRLYAVVWNSEAGASPSTIPGFTQIYANSSNNQSVTILKKIAASEGGSYTVTVSGTQRAAAHILAFRGGLGTEDVGTVARATPGTAVAASGISATAIGSLVGVWRASTDGLTVSSPPSGMALKRLANTNASDAFYELTPSPAGATGSKSLTWSASSNIAGILMQIY